MTVWTEGLTAWLQRPNRREMLVACFPQESTPAAKLKSKEVLRISFLLGCGFVQEDLNEHYAFLATLGIIEFDGVCVKALPIPS